MGFVDSLWEVLFLGESFVGMTLNVVVYLQLWPRCCDFVILLLASQALWLLYKVEFVLIRLWCLRFTF